jgi:hypothetical protein
MENIKGYYYFCWSSSSSTIEKSYNGYTVSPVIVASALLNLVIFCYIFVYGE